MALALYGAGNRRSPLFRSQLCRSWRLSRRVESALNGLSRFLLRLRLAGRGARESRMGDPGARYLRADYRNDKLLEFLSEAAVIFRVLPH